MRTYYKQTENEVEAERETHRQRETESDIKRQSSQEKRVGVKEVSDERERGELEGEGGYNVFVRERDGARKRA